MKPATTNVGIKRKVGTLVVETFQSHVMEDTTISENIEGNVEEPMHKQPRVDHLSELVEQVVAVDPNVLASWEHKVNSLMEEFVKEKLTLRVLLLLIWTQTHNSRRFVRERKRSPYGGEDTVFLSLVVLHYTWLDYI